MNSLEKTKVKIPIYEKLLSNPDTLQIVGKSYLERYQPNSKSVANTLFTKDMLDHYVVGQLSGDNAKEFINSDQFLNYSSYIINTAQQKVQVINGKKYYPEIVTNPVLSNPEYRRLVLSKIYPADQINRTINGLNKNETGYKSFLKVIEKHLDNGVSISQGELNMVGDYLYSSRDFDSGLAKSFACYMFNDATQRRDLSSSTQIGGALVNYFAYKNTLDDRLKDRRIIIANNVGWDNRNNKMKTVNTGVSTQKCCVLEQNKINDMSISSEEGLSKSRPETIIDLYSLMLVSFHELTHDYQRFMMLDGKEDSSAMAYILNEVLRKNQSRCFPAVNKDLSKVFDKNGNEVKTDYYRANHDNDEIEIQADEEAWRQCRKFIHEHEVQYYWNKKDNNEEKHRRAFEHWRKCQDNEEEVRFRRTFALKVDENGQEMPYIQYDIEQLSKSIKEDPNIVKPFPQLTKFFDDTGNIKPEIFFNKKIARTYMDAIDTITDDFGVEVGTYVLMDSSSIKNILSYIHDPDNNLSDGQIRYCLSNLWSVLRQCALKIRPLKKINYDTYTNTATRGKNTSIDDLKTSYLKQYLHQLYNATNITEALSNRYSEAAPMIAREEFFNLSSYYTELSKGVKLDPDFSKKVKNLYLRTKKPALFQVAMRM